MSLQPGDTIEGKYRIVRLLGEGGMGAVYEGENIRIHRKVAIKILHAAVAAQSDAVQRFEREAQAAGRIGSEHIVEVLDLGSLAGGERFMVMEFLEGESLGDRITRKKRMSTHEVAHILHEILEGLNAAHAAKIIHRDLKPDNVFLLTSRAGRRDFVKILDFGVSKFSSLDSDMSMTKTGAVMGTPFYMSPEQARGGKVDFRSDLYSAGVAAYEAVTGRVPFNAETFNELVFKIALESPEPAELVAPGLDPAFAAIIARAMIRDPAGRFQTAREFQAAVDGWLMSAAPDPMFNGGSGSMPLGMLQGNAPGVRTGSIPAIPPSSRGSNAPSPPSSPDSAPRSSTREGIGAAPGSGRAALSQSGSALGQSGLALRESRAQLSGSQTGMAMTPPEPRKSGAVIAISVVAMLALAGGGFGAYRAFIAKSPAPPAVPAEMTTNTAEPSAQQPAEPPPTVNVEAPPAEPPPTVNVEAPPLASAPVEATSQVSAPVIPPRLGKPWPKSTPSSTPSSTAGAATAAPSSTQPAGRIIHNEL
jgi:eukaryotic-like serine/threonine-protein kinase